MVLSQLMVATCTHRDTIAVFIVELCRGREVLNERSSVDSEDKPDDTNNFATLHLLLELAIFVKAGPVSHSTSVITSRRHFL